MTMRVLQIGPLARKRVAKVVGHSKKKKNWFLTGAGGKYAPGTLPGHDRRHRCQLDDYRCVFSYTCSDNLVWRHLSISVGDSDDAALPHPAAIRWIAHLFGFTGAGETPDRVDDGESFPSTWVIQIRKDHPIDDDCIVLAEDTGLRP